jgi:hypothetical protein
MLYTRAMDQLMANWVEPQINDDRSTNVSIIETEKGFCKIWYSQISRHFQFEIEIHLKGITGNVFYGMSSEKLAAIRAAAGAASWFL